MEHSIKKNTATAIFSKSQSIRSASRFHPVDQLHNAILLAQPGRDGNNNHIAKNMPDLYLIHAMFQLLCSRIYPVPFHRDDPALSPTCSSDISLYHSRNVDSLTVSNQL